MKLREGQRERIREQSKVVAEHMAKPKKYQVIWTCPHCGNEHNWWWEDDFEAYSEGESHMVCDCCEARVLCVGDGTGYYEPIEESESSKQRTLDQINSTLDELQTSRLNQFSLLTKLSDRGDKFEDRIDVMSEDLYAAVNSLAKHVARIEEKVDGYRGELDNIGTRLTTAETAILNVEEGASINTYSHRKKKPSIIDLIHGTPPAFHERFREGCELDDMSGETIARILRFIAVEVERMTDRSMGGSYTVSNIEVGQRLRGMATEAEYADSDTAHG